MSDNGLQNSDRRSQPRPARRQLRSFLGHLSDLRRRRRLRTDELTLLSEEDDVEFTASLDR